MTLFAVLAWDVADSATPRLAARDDHFAHIATVVDRIAVAGPLKDAAGRAVGSLLVFDVETADEAEALLKRDPYYLAGVWARFEIHPFLAAAGQWVGGTIW